MLAHHQLFPTSLDKSSLSLWHTTRHLSRINFTMFYMVTVAFARLGVGDYTVLKAASATVLVFTGFPDLLGDTEGHVYGMDDGVCELWVGYMPTRTIIRHGATRYDMTSH
jgi:hypothetical protein